MHRKKVVTRGQIRDALETTYREYFGEFSDSAFANAVQGFLDGEVDPVEIAETIIGTYSGSFSFVLVDAHTAKCLTFRRINGLYPIVDYTVRVRTVEDVVRAAAYLLSLLGVRVESDQPESEGGEE